MEAGIEAAGKAEVEGAKAKARAGEEGAEAAIKTTLEKELAEEAKAREEATVKYQGETEDVSEDKVTGGALEQADEAYVTQAFYGMKGRDECGEVTRRAREASLCLEPTEGRLQTAVKLNTR